MTPEDAVPTLCPHCGIDLTRYEPGDERFDHLLNCARAHDDPEREQRRQEANAEMLAMLPYGAEGLRRHTFGPPRPQREAPPPVAPKKFTRR